MEVGTFSVTLSKRAKTKNIAQETQGKQAGMLKDRRFLWLGNGTTKI